jgi:thymidylate synthase
MRVLEVRNVHEALPLGVNLLRTEGINTASRNGPVLVAPYPVSTVYRRPQERVLFWEKRDANPFLHLYEALWMLQGRNDIQPLGRYAKQMLAYSDDGTTQHGAYGFRWRNHFNYDQLRNVANQLMETPFSRRAVVQMWDANVDGVGPGKDFPCNMMITFQINPKTNNLDMVVFNRSNDIVWGAYGANAVHFSVLLEYMAAMIGVFPGLYTQVSVNYHGYITTLDKVLNLYRRSVDLVPEKIPNPYRDMNIRVLSMFSGEELQDWDKDLHRMMDYLDGGMEPPPSDIPFIQMAGQMLRAHAIWKAEGLQAAWQVLDTLDSSIDWVLAAYEWLSRRKRT